MRYELSWKFAMVRDRRHCEPPRRGKAPQSLPQDRAIASSFCPSNKAPVFSPSQHSRPRWDYEARIHPRRGASTSHLIAFGHEPHVTQRNSGIIGEARHPKKTHLSPSIDSGFTPTNLIAIIRLAANNLCAVSGVTYRCNSEEGRASRSMYLSDIAWGGSDAPHILVGRPLRTPPRVDYRLRPVTRHA